MSYQADPIFQTKNGIVFPAFSKATLGGMFDRLEKELGVTPAQYCEAASYSMAMVVRYALGLSAEGGKVTGLIADSKAGWVALGTLRHLQNCGTAVHLILLNEGTHGSYDLKLQLQPLTIGGAKIYPWSALLENQATIHQLLTTSHNIICGLYDSAADNKLQHSDLVRVLNDLSTPIHCIEAPLGLDEDLGQPGPEPLFASSTLSLGAPLAGLYRGNEYVGRHYLCDVSFSPEVYNQAGFDLSLLFSEQPVLQIHPKKESEEKAD